MKLLTSIAAALSIVGYATAQNVGTQKQDQHLQMGYQMCSGLN